VMSGARAGIPGPPDAPSTVPGAPSPPPGPEEPLEPGFPQPPPDEEEDDEDDLAGRWRVERVGGLLPPGLRKQIGRDGGSTRLGPFPLALFRVRGSTLDYRMLPVRDELAPAEAGTWLGRGLLFGREFCRFRLVRDEAES
jgi:hypothetical protein